MNLPEDNANIVSVDVLKQQYLVNFKILLKNSIIISKIEKELKELLKLYSFHKIFSKL